jgi:6-phospho-3-hexuloisomerase
LLKADRIFIAGKGRTGFQMQAFAMRLMHLGLKVHVIGEVTTPAIKVGDLLVIGSSSGQTESLVAFASKAEVLGISIAALTANRESLIAKSAEAHVYIPAPSHKVKGSEASRKVLPMGGLFEASLGIVVNLFVVQMMAQLGVTEEEMVTRHANLE